MIELFAKLNNLLDCKSDLDHIRSSNTLKNGWEEWNWWSLNLWQGLSSRRWWCEDEPPPSKPGMSVHIGVLGRAKLFAAWARLAFCVFLAHTGFGHLGHGRPLSLAWPIFGRESWPFFSAEDQCELTKNHLVLGYLCPPKKPAHRPNAGRQKAGPTPALSRSSRRIQAHHCVCILFEDRDEKK